MEKGKRKKNGGEYRENKQISMTPTQWAKVDQLSAELGITRSEFFKRAIDDFITYQRELRKANDQLKIIPQLQIIASQLIKGADEKLLKETVRSIIDTEEIEDTEKLEIIKYIDKTAKSHGKDILNTITRPAFTEIMKKVNSEDFHKIFLNNK